MAAKIKKKRLVSIVIKSESIKIAELSRSSKQIKVHKMIFAQTPEGSVNGGMIEDPTELAFVIYTAMTRNKISCKDVVFSLVSDRIATKEIIIPDVKESRIGDIVNANASEYFPVNIDQYIMKYAVLEKFQDEEGKKLKLQVIAAPSSLVESYYTLADILKLNIETIDYAGNSSYQELKQQITGEFSVVINVENEITAVNIFENNALKMQRTIPVGKSALVETVREKYGLESDKEALTKLQEEKLLHTSFDGDEVTESLSYLVGSISRVTDYYISRNGSVPFEKAYIVGRLTAVQGLTELLSNELNLELNSIDSLKNVIVDSKQEAERVTSYVTNVGAVLQPIGLTRIEEQQKSASKEGMRLYVLILLFAIAVAIALVAMPYMDVLSLKNDVNKAQKRVDDLSDILITVNQYYAAMDMYRDAESFAALTVNNNDYLYNLILNLEDKIPSDVFFTNMNINSGQVNISGRASSKSSVAKLIQQLQTIPTVESVYVSNESESKDNADVITVTFTLTCTFGEVPEPQENETDTETGDENAGEDTATDENTEE